MTSSARSRFVPRITFLTRALCRLADDRGVGDEGAQAVEFALLMPILLAFVLGIIDFGRLWYTQVDLSQAARAGARLEALGSSTVYTSTSNATTGLSGIKVYINGTQYTANPSSPVSCPTGTDATVRVVYPNFTFTLSGLIGLGPKTLAATGVMPCGG
jgi:hypothetical protein